MEYDTHLPLIPSIFVNSLCHLISAMDFPVGKRRRIIKRRHSVKKNIFIFLISC